MTKSEIGETEHPSDEQLARFMQGINGSPEIEQAIESHLNQCLQCQSKAMLTDQSHFERILAEVAKPSNPTERRISEGYEIESEVGRGGAGIVYRARHKSLDRTVALKVLLPGDHANFKELARFRREANSLAKLNHPNIVHVFDCGEQNGSPYVAMEFIEGPTLFAALRGLPLAPNTSARLIATLAEAVSHAHSHGVLHRDLKPQNILLSQLGCPKDSREPDSISEPAELDWSRPIIVDFGLARSRNDEGLRTQTGEILGTPAYLAPEMIRIQEGAVGPAVDIYGLGTILYECLTGRPPFQGSTIAELLTNIANTDPPSVRFLRPNVPVDLDTIVMRCLSKSPLKRFPNVGELSRELNRFLNGEPIVSRAVSDWERAWRWCLRSPWRATALAALGLFLLLLPVAALYHSRQLELERAKAVANYESVRASLWQVLDRATENQNSGIPKVLELTLAQGKAAHELFEKLSKEENSTRAQLDLAKSKLMVATLSIELNRLPEADSLLEQTIQICEKIDSPASMRSEAIRLLASAYNKRSVSLMAQGSPQQALQSLDASLEILEQLADLEPNQSRWQSDRAWTHHNMGTAHLMTQNLDSALDHYQKSVELRERLDPKDIDFKDIAQGIAGSLVNMALIHSRKGETEIADTEYRRALQKFQMARDNGSNELTIVSDWSSAILNLATLLGNRGELTESKELCTQGIVELRKLVEQEPNRFGPRDNLWKLLATRAQLHDACSEAILSGNDWLEAAKINPDRAMSMEFQNYGIRALAKGGKAVEMIEQLEKLPTEEEATNRWVIAETWGTIAGAVASDQAIDSKEQSLLIKTCCEHSLQILKELHREGMLTEQMKSQMADDIWSTVKANCAREEWTQFANK